MTLTSWQYRIGFLTGLILDALPHAYIHIVLQSGLVYLRVEVHDKQTQECDIVTGITVGPMGHIHGDYVVRADRKWCEQRLEIILKALA